MSKGLEALDKIRVGCLTVWDFEDCTDAIEKELKEYQEIETYMQQYGIENIEEIRRVLHNDWVIRQKFKTDTANVVKALEIIKNKKVAYLLIWLMERHTKKCALRLYNEPCDEDRKLTQEEYDLLKEVLLWD